MRTETIHNQTLVQPLPYENIDPVDHDRSTVMSIGKVPLSIEINSHVEKLNHKSIIAMEVEPKQIVSLTTLDDFKPEVVPGWAVRDIPDNLHAYVDDTYASTTFNTTVSNILWKQRVLDVTENYLLHHADGRKLMADLNIKSLQKLTPEQAVKLSTEFVRAVSKYSHDDTKSTGLTRADNSTTYDLLQEGLSLRGNATWGGNGVCRNIAANVKAVFESLKSCQDDETMLANTYCKIDVGYDGDGYEDKRVNPHRTNLNKTPGHAWNLFTTIGENGSAIITIVDSTWALGGNRDETSADVDRTRERSGKIVNDLFEKSVDKEAAFNVLTDYYHRLAGNISTGTDQVTKERIREYALTQYLQAAKYFPTGVEGVYTPTILLGVAYQASNKLDPSEIETLYRHDKCNGSTEESRIRGIIKRAYEKPWVSTGGTLAEKFLFVDSEFQKFVFESLGKENLPKMSERSTNFRIRLRELRPESLPSFNSNNPLDLRELKALAQRINPNIVEDNPDKIVARVKRYITSVSQDENITAVVLVGRSDYDIVKNAPEIIKQLKQMKK